MSCWSFEPLIGFPLCGCELFAPHSPISPLEPDMGGGTTFRGALGGLNSSSASCESALGGLDSVGVPGAVAPCCSFEPLIGFPLEPVCGAELFAPHSPISPLEPDIGGDAVSAAAGKMRNAMKKAVTTRQTHLRGPRKAKRGIIDPGERSAATPTNKVLGKLPTRPHLLRLRCLCVHTPTTQVTHGHSR